ncbi:MAG TPA: hypothetical protein VGR38_00675 [Candidatus Polarisedimenticolia bacterium]|jgi:hypothetical protein|nr:hypothetical protein [Candidatus Polarisedimenticolia bacterium]
MRKSAGAQSGSKAVREIQAGLKRLSRGFRLLTRELVEEASRHGGARRKKVSPGRKIHGRYIGLIRNLPGRQKAKVRALRARRGVQAAIRMAREMRRDR